MITPRRTRLLRVPSLGGMRALITRIVRDLDPVTAADTFVLVPTRAAAEQLRRTVEDRLLPQVPSLSWPLAGPRSDLYRELIARAPRLLAVRSAFDREVILGRLAREIADAGTMPPFAIRPALIAEMIALYDHIRRQARTVEDFERNLLAELEPAMESDRGAAQLVRQTRFLAAAFHGYEAHLAAYGWLDEHGAREVLIAEPAARPLRHVIVAVADRVADADGLWPVDFTLLSALPSLERLDVIATEAMLSAGLLERVHAALPGLSEVQASTIVDDLDTTHPRLQVPADRVDVYDARDREEELMLVARRIKAARRAGDATPLSRTGLVVRRPLPYLYLARSTFTGAGIPFETLDTLPLAAEPFAAALDLVLDAVATGFARGPLLALLRSVHFRFDTDDDPLPMNALAALDQSLASARYLGGLDRLERLAAEWNAIQTPASRDERRHRTAAPAARLAVSLARELSPLAEPRTIPHQLTLLDDVLDRYGRPPAPAVDAERLARVQHAVCGALASLGRAYAEHDPDATATGIDLSFAIRRWLGAQTFAAHTGDRGLRVLDAQAARFADLDDVQLMGLVEGEWPEMQRRSIFYPPFLLGLLEPTPAADDPNQRDSDAMAAARAAFLDLLLSARHRVRVSTFLLESDAVVEPSPMLDELTASGLLRDIVPAERALAVSMDEALLSETPVMDALPSLTREWAALRAERPPAGDPRHSGEAGEWAFRRISVSRIDRYLKCPFQFFATEVLALEEEPEDEDAPPPWERGRFLHGLFETFFREWQQRGHGSISADRVPEARALLVEISERALATLPDTEAALERTRLRGSAVSAGIIDRVLAMEAERPAPIARRLMEYGLDAPFVFRREDGTTRVVPLRAQIDRVDVLRDGTFRVIDYKSKTVPDVKRTVQLQVYTAAVAQQLERESGTPRTPSEAFYLSMEGDAPIKALKPAKGQALDDVLKAAEERMLGAIDDIGAGHFPPRPTPRSLCNYCPFDAVCRKAFVEAADE